MITRYPGNIETLVIVNCCGCADMGPSCWYWSYSWYHSDGFFSVEVGKWRRFSN